METKKADIDGESNWCQARPIFRSNLFLAALFSLFFSLLLLSLTSNSTGISPDSVTYFEAARNFRDGFGLLLGNPEQGLTPLSHYPPLYPTLMVLLFGDDNRPFFYLRFAQALFFGLTAIFVFLLASKITNSRLFPFVSMLVFLTSPFMLHLHAMAWSESMFLFLTFFSIFILSNLKASKSKRAIILMAAFLASLALMTRYVGIALIFSQCIWIALDRKEVLKRRVFTILGYLLVALLPLILWHFLGASSDVSGKVGNRPWAWHPVGIEQFFEIAKVISLWFFPWNDAVLLVTSAAVIFWFLFYFARNCFGFKFEKSEFQEGGDLRVLLLIFCSVYLILVLFSKSFLDSAIPLDSRILSPLFPVLAILLVPNKLTETFAKKEMGLVLATLVVLVVFFNAYKKSPFRNYEYWQSQLGYGAANWSRSPTILAVRNLESEIPIFSNAPDAIFILTGHRASFIPKKMSPTSGEINGKFEEQIQSLVENLKSTAGKLVYHRALAWRKYLPSEVELRKLDGLIVEKDETDGIILAGEGSDEEKY